MNTKKAVVIGATSGIGRELAKVLSENNYIVGLTGRRIELLFELQKEIQNKTYINHMDVAQTSEAIRVLKDLISEMNGMDMIIINAGIGFINPDLEWDKEKATIDVNVSGFTAMASAAFEYFHKQGYGHIVSVSSIAALLGSADAPAYNASKAFISNYMKGLRQKANKLNLPVVITDIKPGFVDTKLAISDNLFWVSSTEKAALQIYSAIKHKKRHAYITKRWRLIAWLLKITPDWIISKI